MKKFDLSNIFNVKGKSARHKIINQFGLDKYDKRAFLNNLEELEKKAESGGGESGEESEIIEKDFTFIDVDGNVLYTYTSEEALSLTELPVAPEIEGLTFKKWYYEIDDIKSLNGYGVNIPLYTTGTYNTKFYVELEDDNQSVCFGTQTDYKTFNFEKKGIYCIELVVPRTNQWEVDAKTIRIECGNIISGSVGICLTNCYKLKTIVLNEGFYIDTFPNNNNYLKWAYFTSTGIKYLHNVKYFLDHGTHSVPISNKINKLYLSNNKSIDNLYNLKEVISYKGNKITCTFSNLPNLKKISSNIIFNNISYCPNLESDVEIFGMCTYMDKIKKITFSYKSSSVPYTFACNNLEYIIFDYNFTGNNYVFGIKCPKLKYILFTNNTSVPTKNVTQFPTGQFVVPDNLYDEWVNATNWADVSDRIIKVSDYESLNV